MITRHADLLFVVPSDGSGSIWAGRPGTTAAVAVRDGRIVALDREALDHRGPSTEVIELVGRTLLPAFRDGHLHPLAGGAETLDGDLVDAVDVADVLARLRTFAQATPDVPWVLGYGYPPEILPGGVGRASTLDEVVADRPVALWSSDHHMVWCNTLALQRADITAGTIDPPRGTIVRDADGHPVGTLLEEAELLLDEHLPPRGLDKEARGLEVGLQRMVSAGIVWGQDAWTRPEALPSYLHVADAGRLTADLDLAFKVDVDRWRDQPGDFEDARRDAARSAQRRLVGAIPGGRLTATTVKFFIDGVIEGGTGAMLEPYCVMGDGAGHGGYDHGIANWERDELAQAAAAMDAAGFQLHMHAIGDAAIRLALDTVEEVAARNGPRDRRPVVAHTHLVHPDDRRRFRELGVIANFEPLWAQDNDIMRELTEPRLGPRRSGWQYPIGSLVRSGARVSFGSDWPVSSHVPLDGIAVAVTRRGRTGRAAQHAFLPDEAISLEQALAAYTSGTAFQAGDEHDAGQLAVGQRADLIVIDQNLQVVAPHELPDVGIEGTWLRGARIHGC